MAPRCWRCLRPPTVRIARFRDGKLTHVVHACADCIPGPNGHEVVVTPLG